MCKELLCFDIAAPPTVQTAAAFAHANIKHKLIANDKPTGSFKRIHTYILYALCTLRCIYNCFNSANMCDPPFPAFVLQPSELNNPRAALLIYVFTV